MHLIIAGISAVTIIIKFTDSFKKIRQGKKPNWYDYLVVLSGSLLFIWAVGYLLYQHVIC